MEEKQDTDVDDVDRESLVKEIELIRQTLGGESNRAQQADGDFVSYDEKDSDDSEDELAIIKSPGYQESADKTYGAQNVPVEVISCESEDEVLGTTPKNRTLPGNVSRDTEFSANGNISYEVSAIVPLNNESDEVEPLLRPVAKKPDSGTESIQTSSEKETLPSRRQSNSFENEEENADYTLVELQPIVTNQELPLGDFQSISSGVPDRNANIESSVAGTVAEEGLSDEKEEEPLLSDEEESKQLSEEQRCLKLNRKYQAIIEAQLRKIEKLIVENMRQQDALNQMTSSTLSKTENFDFRHISSYANPYFRKQRREHPDDNEDTKLRKSIGQPHPFEKRPSLWRPEERKILEDAVRSEVLQAKLTPLLQKVETFVHKKAMTEEEEKELEVLRKEIDHLKTLPLSVLVEDFTETIDFGDISNKMLPYRTPQQCQMFWYNELHPLLNQGKWTKEEDKQLLKLATENSDGGRWDKIACELKSNRSPVQCLRRYQKSLNTDFLKSKWEPEDDRKLLEAIEMCGVGTWEKASSFLEGRTGPQCMHRYNNSLAPNIKKGKWAKEEDDLVRKGVALYGFNWARFRNVLPTRTVSQIRERWQDVLDPKVKKAKWTKEEDQKLLKVVEEHGIGLKNWTIIAKNMNGRTDNMCRRRWFFLNRNDPKAKEHLHKQKFSRANLVNNFSRRHADKPEIGPDDFDIPEMSETDNNAVADNGAEAVRNCTPPADSAVDNVATRTRNAKTRSPPKSPKKSKAQKESFSADSPEKNAEKNKPCKPPKLSGAQKRKQTKSSKSPKKSEISISDKLETKKMLRSVSKKKLKKDKGSPSPTTLTVPAPSKRKKTSTRPPKKTKKPKLTAPSPTVVSQASALPNALPMSYLTQFSVLLQAFHVDVSGVLSNVNSPRSATTSGPIPSITTTVTTSASPPTPITTIAQTAAGTGIVSKKVIASTANNASMTMTMGRVVARTSPTPENPPTSITQTPLQRVGKGTVSNQVFSSTANNASITEACVGLPIASPSPKTPPTTVTQTPSQRTAKCTESNQVLANTANNTSINSTGMEVVSITSATPRTPLTSITQTPSQCVGKGEANRLVSTHKANSASIAATGGKVVPISSAILATQPITNAQTSVQTTANSKRSSLVQITTIPPNNAKNSVGLSTELSDDTKEQAVSISGNDKNCGVSSVEAINTGETPTQHTSLLSEGDITEPVLNVRAMFIKEATSMKSVEPGIAPTEVISNSEYDSISKNSCVVSCDRNNMELGIPDPETRELSADILRATAIQNNASKTMSNSIPEVSDNNSSEGSTLTSDIEVMLSVSNGGANKSNTLSKSSGEGNTLESNNPSLLEKRKRNNTDDMDRNGEKQKRLHGGVDKDAVDQAEKDLGEKTTTSAQDESDADSVLLSDTRHGLNHDIVVFPSSPSPAAQNEGLEPGRTPKRKQDEDRPTTHRKKQKKTSSEGTKATDGVSNLGDMEQVQTSPRRYPKRSNRGHQEVDVSVPSERVSSDLNVRERESIQIERVPLNSTNDVTLLRVPAIPPLPPSATTLNAFKKLLTLRKDLQSQANRLIVTPKHPPSAQAAAGRLLLQDKPSNQNTSTTTVQSPIADRLLLVSSTEQTLHEEFRNSVPYQQLLNRFKGLFMWPGFLSIVNPSFVKQTPGPSNGTPKKKQKKRRIQQKR